MDEEMKKETPPETDAAEKSRKKKSNRKEKSDQLIRIGELEAMMEKYGEDVDPEKIVSMYMPIENEGGSVPHCCGWIV